MTEPSLAVAARGVTRRFGDLVAVDSLDLDVPAGAVVALLGPNGAGKTTTVRMIATLDAPSDGHITVCGYDTRADAESVRRVLSLTGQFAALEDNLTALENLTLMARLRGYDAKAARQVTGHLVERFDIGEFRDKLVKDVSGGQRRRIDLAASLVTRPEVLVLDEPTTGLDPRSRQVVWSTIRELVDDGVTLLLTTQYLEEADVLADTIVLIDHGRVVASGTPADLKGRIGEQRVDIRPVDGGGVDGLLDALGGDFDVSVSAERKVLSIPAPGEVADLTRISAVVHRSGVAVDEVALRRPTLDDAFLALTGQPAETDPDPRAADAATRAGAVPAETHQGARP